MKFPRNARIFRGRLDAAPFAAVFFLLALFIMLTNLVYTPGVRLELPTASDLPGFDKPSVSVAMDAQGRLYFQDQWIEEKELRTKLALLVKNSTAPLTLIVQADKSVAYEKLVALTLLAREAGINSAWLATLPRPQPLTEAPGK